MQQSPDAIFFDLDDTIVADSNAADRCWMTVCERYTSAVAGATAQTLYDELLIQRDWFWSDAVRHQRGRRDMLGARREIVSRAFASLGLDAPQLAEQLAADYTEERHRLVEPFPGALETIDAFARRGIPLALLTNGDARYQRDKILRFNLQRYFRHIVIEGEFGIGKPDEAVFLSALAALNARAEYTWMVGNDLRFDIAPALRLGLTAIWVDVHGRGLPLDPPCIPSQTVRSIRELIA